MHIQKWILSFGVLISAILFSIVIGTPSVEAQILSCANVRCAGSCVDTPGGPVCEPQRLTCASTLCEQGNQCIETQSGPQCVPLSRPHYDYQPNHYQPSYHYNPQPYYNPQPWRRYWRQNWQPPALRTWTPWHRSSNPDYYRPPTYHWSNFPIQRTPNFPGTNINACTLEYDPVCAQKTVQCFRAPCPPLQKTFGNACSARVEGYSVISKGVCP